jgi:hypothetical protein
VAGITSTDVVAIRHRLIAAKYKAHARDKRPPKPPFSRSSLRVRELERLYRLRYGRHLPDDDAGRDDLELAFNQIARVDACIQWAAKWAPWMARDEAAAKADLIAMDPQWLKARPLGELLGLTDSERTRLDIRTIRPIDLTDEALVARSKQKRNERKALNRRRTTGPKPPPLGQSKPWEAEGICRRTWERRRAKSVASQHVAKPAPHNTVSFIGDTFCDTANPVGTPKPPADASGTPSKTISFARVDGAAIVGSPSRRLKTRFPTAMRLSKEMWTFALKAGFEREKIERMFESFQFYNIAMRSYSADWGAVWYRWVDREVDIVTEDAHPRASLLCWGPQVMKKDRPGTGLQRATNHQPS